MEWMNIHSSTVDGELVQDAPAEEVRCWLFLLRYCCGQENGGRIVGASAWEERKWVRLAGVSVAEVKKGAGLWRWEGMDLVVEFYPLKQERVLESKRQGGAIGGRARAKKGVLQATGKGVLEGVLEATGEGVLQGKGREGKERKGKGRVREEVALSRGGDVLIPTEEEVRTWAGMSGVDGEFASEKWAGVSERHGWVANGKLLDWRRRFKRFWEEDKVEWLARRKSRGQNGQAGGGGGVIGARPSGWCEGDQDFWWSEPVELVERALTGALLGGDEKNAARLRVVIGVRRK